MNRAEYKNVIFIKYSSQYPYLPVAVADSVKELSEQTGVNPISIYTCLKRENSSYRAVTYDDNEEPIKYPDNDGGVWYYDEDGRVVYEA